MRDNEKIVEAIANVQSCLKLNLVRVCEADASAETIRAFGEALREMDKSLAGMGDRYVTELLAPIEKRLNDLVTKIEGDRQ